MKSKLYRILYLLTNLFVWILNILIRRDKKVWLFGAWMGNRFSDNPRFLYQYLQDKKNEYPIDRLIWVTRNAKVYCLLQSNGYEVYMCGSICAFYWHIKAGVHIVCDIPNHTGNYLGDIDGLFSWGAIKIQLWHGVGIKACGKLKNDSINYNGKRYNKKFRHYFYPGGWDKCFWIVTSEEDARSKSLDFSLDKEQLIISSYPRNCTGLHCFEEEQKIIDSFLTLKENGMILAIYLPTFRSKDEENNFVAPLQIEGFTHFIEANNVIWIEKRHASSNYHCDKITSKNVLYVDANFDVNLLYDVIDIAVSDYSSAISDALIKGKKVLHYVPDYDHYSQEDRGFVADYFSYNPGIVVKDPLNLIDAIKNTISDTYFTPEISRKYNECKSFLYGNESPNLDSLCQKILSVSCHNC